MNAIKRREKKYLLNKEQYQSLINEISNKIVEDKYGLQTIRNIYFDNDYYQVIRTSLEKPKFKEKLRLRCYGLPDDQSDVFLEIKKKYKKVVYKRRLNLK
ncbi:MAG: VTC domain-containing protein [Clostridiales bacterium]|nr:VTC domain-containing protein [Clostridiales bacterium]